jgi:hypothetical protein
VNVGVIVNVEVGASVGVEVEVGASVGVSATVSVAVGMSSCGSGTISAGVVSIDGPHPIRSRLMIKDKMIEFLNVIPFLRRRNNCRITVSRMNER